MRRLVRWVFNAAVGLSALLFVGLCILWQRSYHTCFCLTHESRRLEPRYHGIDSICPSTGPGALILNRERRSQTAPSDWEPGDRADASLFGSGSFWWDDSMGREQPLPGWHYEFADDPLEEYPTAVDRPPLPDFFGFIFNKISWDNAARDGGIFARPDPSPQVLEARGLGRDTGDRST